MDLAELRGRADGPTHVVWDWNGTLLDDASTVIEATTAAFREAGLSVTVTAEIYRRLFTRPIQLFYERLLGRAIATEEWIRMDHAFHLHYGRLRERCQLAPGSVAVLEEIRRRAWTQSVCSMLPEEYLVPALELHGIAEYFVRVDGLRDGERGGAKLEHLARHVTRLGVPRSRTVLIGDTVDDAVAARGAGIGCILLDAGAGLHEPAAIAAAGAPVAGDLTEAFALLTGLASGGRPTMAPATTLEG